MLKMPTITFNVYYLKSQNDLISSKPTYLHAQVAIPNPLSIKFLLLLSIIVASSTTLSTLLVDLCVFPNKRAVDAGDVFLVKLLSLK